MAVLAAEPSEAQRVGHDLAPRPAAAVALVVARAAHRLPDALAVGPDDAAPAADAATTGRSPAEPDPPAAPPIGGYERQDPPGAATLVDGPERSTGPAGEVAVPAGAPAPASGDVEPVNRRFVTEWAGLLFLLPVVERTGLVTRALEGPGASFGLRRLLYAVGQALGRRLVHPAGLDPDDPALLVWCGLAPGQDPPDGDPVGVDPVGVDPGDTIESVAEEETDRLVAELRRLLAPDPIAEADEAELLSAVCARHGLVVADPGWIDVHLALDDVSTVVRRAGLDLDPGYRPWLGVVVRFRYA